MGAGFADLAERQRQEAERQHQEAARLRAELAAQLADWPNAKAVKPRGSAGQRRHRQHSTTDLAALAPRPHRLQRTRATKPRRAQATRADVDARLALLLERLEEAEQETGQVRDLTRRGSGAGRSLHFRRAGKAEQGHRRRERRAAACAPRRTLRRSSNAASPTGATRWPACWRGCVLFDGARTESRTRRWPAIKDEVAAPRQRLVQSETSSQALAALEARVDHDLADLRARADQALRDLHSGFGRPRRQASRRRRGRRKSSTTCTPASPRTEGQSAEAVDRMHGLARMMSRITAQNADAADQTEDRLHQVWRSALADMRVDRGGRKRRCEPANASPASSGARPMRSTALHATLARFIVESERRLGEIEQHAGGAAPSPMRRSSPAPSKSRLTALEQMDVTSQLDLLRRRFEDRLTGLEGRSVRALEQVAETVAHIERRFHQASEDETWRAAPEASRAPQARFRRRFATPQQAARGVHRPQRDILRRRHQQGAPMPGAASAPTSTARMNDSSGRPKSGREFAAPVCAIKRAPRVRQFVRRQNGEVRLAHARTVGTPWLERI